MFKDSVCVAQDSFMEDHLQMVQQEVVIVLRN